MAAFACVESSDFAAQGQCPAGFAETAAQTFVLFDASLPSGEIGGAFFALGFVAAFCTARAISMIIRSVVQLMRS